ncbi:MAG: O-succinylhomoserine sulfhydrylase [Gammaproteobacteria bacterium]|nr:MAG: O-succinylhomoserine sulfhydrylase [Gammaproteobacteria bacterium]RTZ74890.1 MAG: O-succinylhomoserine sulfhydrylase [Gammaproteobacteria bacterium]RTZ76976.1 MAG: O-succinylhomoserine sulfhydrylase [Gammaproteobacteria bacterium]
MTTKKMFLRPCTWVYLFLLSLTFVTWFIGVNNLSGRAFAFTVLGFALIKGQLIGDYFMGLKQVAGPWRWVIFVWLLLIGSLITAAFWKTL